MIKFTSNNDFNFDCASVELLRDTSKDLTKRASAKELMKVKKTANQEDLHIIAVGAYEGTGFNRNGDAFLEKDCEDNHHYFTRSNRAVHRHHKNKPTDPKFGNIKVSAYNKPMKRIELVVGLDRDKCADILHEQETTGNTNWSMASKQAHDECSWCHHKALDDKTRCEHIPQNLGEINKIGEMCGMINPNPRWFEISYVRRPADRIGMSLGKVASDNNVVRPISQRDYFNLYGDLYVPDDVYISKKASDKRFLLQKLAVIEKHVDMVANTEPKNSKDSFIKEHGHKINKTPSIDGSSMDELRKMDPSAVLKTLADHGIIFSPEDFSRYLFDNRLHKKNMEGMKSHLPHAFNEFEHDGEVANNEKYEPSTSSKAPAELKNLTNKLEEKHSLNEGPAIRRIMMITISGNMEPKHKEEATKEAADIELAKQYTAYKLAALNYLDEQGKLDEDIMLNAVLQNR